MGTAKTAIRPRIMILDDEVDLIHGLRRALRSTRLQFDIEYFTTPREALERLATCEFDVIVTDMRMPEIDGAEFLRRAIAYSPTSVRFVLSGQADERTIIRCLPYTHQHIAKPCDVSAVVKRISSVIEQSNSNFPAQYRRMLSSLLRLPVLPSVLRRVREELSSASPSVMVLAECIASDAGLSAKLLQLTSSSFFGHPDAILSPARAAARLGLEVFRKVVFEADVFEDLVLPDELGGLQKALEQTASDALFESAIEETLSQGELAAKIMQRISQLGPVCLAHSNARAGLKTDPAELERLGATATTYLMTILGLPQALIARGAAETNATPPQLAASGGRYDN